jgi:hypothetical protein
MFALTPLWQTHRPLPYMGLLELTQKQLACQSIRKSSNKPTFQAKVIVKSFTCLAYFSNKIKVLGWI